MGNSIESRLILSYRFSWPRIMIIFYARDKFLTWDEIQAKVLRTKDCASIHIQTTSFDRIISSARELDLLEMYSRLEFISFFVRLVSSIYYIAYIDMNDAINKIWKISYKVERKITFGANCLIRNFFIELKNHYLLRLKLDL